MYLAPVNVSKAIKMLLIFRVRSITISFVRFLGFQLFNLFGRANQLSFGNSYREPNDYDLLCSIK